MDIGIRDKVNELVVCVRGIGVVFLFLFCAVAQWGKASLEQQIPAIDCFRFAQQKQNKKKQRRVKGFSTRIVHYFWLMEERVGEWSISE
jgi:Na+-transporting methylmalonyl-CoA/oxaloacetate decarboxylase gamma subunit